MDRLMLVPLLWCTLETMLFPLFALWIRIAWLKAPIGFIVIENINYIFLALPWEEPGRYKRSPTVALFQGIMISWEH